eukprot:CAMPEP_0171461958 /NCGR_PEP_ID=MMETSP0945-20130129/6190_1 /TAXON_ID=109269 /ORGANISM="Vaucheria litorea, Strain CCMP2940" /LENGTH=122 /DNA_ID=CAMNT_0011988393 /DNA_START=570 /DNA_END=938 /DNA_ORIENTATION=+
MIRIKTSDDDYTTIKNEIQDKPLKSVTNFGYVDVLPLKSGKRNAAKYLCETLFKCSLNDCIGIGDDDNDIELLDSTKRGAFVTGLTSKSMEKFVSEHSNVRVSDKYGVYAAEDVLEDILLML